MGWVCYYQEEFEFGHSSYAAKDSIGYYKGWKTQDHDKCYVDWASVTLPTVFDDHLFNVRDAELRVGNYLHAVRTAQPATQTPARPVSQVQNPNAQASASGDDSENFDSIMAMLRSRKPRDDFGGKR